MCDRENTSKQRDAHRTHLAKRGFCKGLDLVGFTQPELDILDRYGYWLCALATGEIPAITEKQSRFQAAASFKKRPQPPFETVWVKFIRNQKRLEKSKTNGSAYGKGDERFDPNKGNVTPSRRGNLSYGKLAPYDPLKALSTESDGSSD